MTKKTLKTSMFEDVITMIRILELIPQRGWVNISQIHAQLEAMGIKLNRRTLQRYLKTIRDNDDIFAIKTNAEHKPYGYQWDATRHGLHLPLPGPQEKLLLRLADESLHYQLPNPVLATLRPLISTAPRSSKRGETGNALTWLKKVKVMSPAMQFLPPQIRPVVFDAVSTSLASNSVLLMRLRDHAGKQMEMRVLPLGLVLQGVRTYLVFQREGDKDFKQLALDCIVAAQALRETFTRPKDFDLEDYTARSHFNCTYGPQIKLELLTDDEDLVQELSAAPFNSSQKIESTEPVDENTAWAITAIVDDSTQLDAWLVTHRASILSTSRTSTDSDNTAADPTPRKQILVRNRMLVEEPIRPE